MKRSRVAVITAEEMLFRRVFLDVMKHASKTKTSEREAATDGEIEIKGNDKFTLRG